MDREAQIMTVVEAGRRGGLATAQHHDHEHYRQLGLTTLERHGREHFVKIRALPRKKRRSKK